MEPEEGYAGWLYPFFSFGGCEGIVEGIGGLGRSDDEQVRVSIEGCHPPPAIIGRRYIPDLVQR